MPNENPMMASMHAPKNGQRAPLNPHELLRRHLNMSINKGSISGRLQGKNDNQKTVAGAEEKESSSLLPGPPARQKTIFCHCFTTCWEPGDATSCACRKAHEPCDPSKCHGPPKRVWLPWGNPDGKPCDCRWTGAKEEEENYGFRENRLKRWLAGDRF